MITSVKSPLALILLQVTSSRTPWRFTLVNLIELKHKQRGQTFLDYVIGVTDFLRPGGPNIRKQRQAEIN